jgi:hypothetical protein
VSGFVVPTGYVLWLISTGYDELTNIYICTRVFQFKLDCEMIGGPQALPGGAKPQVKGVYPPEALRVQRRVSFTKGVFFLTQKNVLT